MYLFGKISLIIWIVIIVSLAIMFDWYGSRELAQTGLEKTQEAVEKLSETGDHMQGALDVIKEEKEKMTE
ncbi:hypothetical protein [Thiomicrorhabdus aquaedulcis]|uniref:hypothetical protein n=1 Tax=Thiomicrorhabdus aquaedulcis TaxID=2211106 RepID=UPI000FDC0B2D|nr:hypothetical protein [Thiomicrorhabdus aquaedulcis]